MEGKNGNNFISYIDFDESEFQNLDLSRDDSFLCENNIKLLPGEVCTAKTSNVLMFSPVSDMTQGISGALCVTNFKLSFVTAESSSDFNTSRTSNGEDFKRRQQNHLFGHTDTCLSNIDNVYLLVGDKKRKLVPGTVFPSKIKDIFIVCKNMRTWTFSFKFSPASKVKTLLIALLHHAFPSRHQLLFGYDYRETNYSIVDKEMKLFYNISDWQQELDRTTYTSSQAKKSWRLSRANEKFYMSRSLPEFVIVPASVTDSQLVSAARHFQDNRPPIWSWSNEQGAALVKMSELSPSLTERTQENIMIENIRNSHPRKDPPIIIELNKDIGVKAVASGFLKFVSLCSPENIRQFWIQDNNFHSSLESTKWLKHVSHCLQKAVEASDHLNSGNSVILQEGAGRDICCIISSLVQLLLDPYFRTIYGLQSLIQKEWVAAGHPFCDRLGHIKNDSEIQKAPLFLLFLDCVWQLCQQFPTNFEFTETYLTTLWDAAHIPIFDTFLFNCDKDRVSAAKDVTNPLVLRSVWNWHEQFEDQDISLFYNPFFNSKSISRSQKYYVKPLWGISHLEFWSQCYFRWIPPLAIRSGGKSKAEIFARILQSDIDQLHRRINGDSKMLTSESDVAVNALQMDSFYPFSNASENVVPIMSTSLLMNDSESFVESDSILTAPD